jgi:NADH:ubiquinone oxidoreductase subunit 2 (subunit N)
VSARIVLDRLSAGLTLVVGAIAIALSLRALSALPTPATLDPTGAFAEDGWTRSCRCAVLLATGLAAIGLVRAPGRRRLMSLGALLLAAAGVVLAAGSLDLMTLWAGVALSTLLAPLAIVLADTRRGAARHALTALLLGGLASGILALAFLALTALSGSTHVLEIGFRITRFQDSGPFALTAVRAAAVGIAMLAAWAPFHLGLPELWGEGSAPLAGWLAIVWPWAGWSVLVRLAGGLTPALEEWSFDAAAAVSVFLVLGALLPGAAALAEERLGRLFALLGVGVLSELLLAVHARGADPQAVAIGLWGYALAWIAGSAALAGLRSRLGDDRLEHLAGLGTRLPRTALAVATAAFLWVGLPGTFTLSVRWWLWQHALGGTSAPLVLVAVALGAFLRMLAVGRLVALLYFRAPSPAAVELGLPLPPPLLDRGRWMLVFLAALVVEVALALGVAPWAERLWSLGPVLLGG